MTSEERTGVWLFLIAAPAFIAAGLLHASWVALVPLGLWIVVLWLKLEYF